MAAFFADKSFDMSKLTFAMLAQPELTSARNNYFELYHEKSDRAFFGEHYFYVGGIGLKYRGGQPSAGSVDNFFWYDFDGEGKPYKQHYQAHSLSLQLADMVAVGRTETLKDDAALIALIYGGKDIMGGSDGADVLLGFGGRDDIAGNKGNDKLFGGDGDDFLAGGLGADFLHGGSGQDYADYFLAAKGVTVNLADTTKNTGEAAGDTYVSIERVRGSDHNDRITGNRFGNILDGGNGQDTLTGGAGRDAFIFADALRKNVDVVTDFNVRDDSVGLSNFWFGLVSRSPEDVARGWSTLPADMFWASANGQAHDESDRIIYNSRSGALLYDRDGTGGEKPELIAALGRGLSLTNHDILVF